MGPREKMGRTPLCFFLVLVQPHFSRGRNIEKPFLGLCLLPNTTHGNACYPGYNIISTCSQLITAIHGHVPGLFFWRGRSHNVALKEKPHVYLQL